MGKGKKYLKRSSQRAEISAGMFLQIQTDIRRVQAQIVQNGLLLPFVSLITSG